MKKQIDDLDLKNNIGAWIAEHTQIERLSDDTFEIATTEIDSYGDTIYCFLEKTGDYYRISDEGNILFKLDPGETDENLYRTAEKIAIGAGFDFDESSCEISVLADKESVAQAVIKLAQLQIAVSYLG